MSVDQKHLSNNLFPVHVSFTASSLNLNCRARIIGPARHAQKTEKIELGLIQRTGGKIKHQGFVFIFSRRFEVRVWVEMSLRSRSMVFPLQRSNEFILMISPLTQSLKQDGTISPIAPFPRNYTPQ